MEGVGRETKNQNKMEAEMKKEIRRQFKKEKDKEGDKKTSGGRRKRQGEKLAPWGSRIGSPLHYS